ncbi:MAG: aminodeoxychorismate synthase, component I, partial [Microcoleus sp. SIO2G3]|nr:aminodeoxychorismate synthase, component I [Microcoleus sp. SIO2G3]
FRSMFPCASITGAPKSRTMQIIKELEETPRRLYTGAIGFLTPAGKMQFNVAIRTALIDKVNQVAEYSIGSGIVWDSVADEEFEECHTKAEILTRSMPQFHLLESLLWTPEAGYFLLDLHLIRLQKSADYFAFSVDWMEIRSQLNSVIQGYTEPQKIRLCVSKQGEIQLEAETVQSNAARPLRVKLAKAPVNSSNVFLYHKTTHRFVYEKALQDWPECDDVLLWNERGELTESCRANLVVEFDRQWYTPPVECGLLAGTFRDYLLQQGKLEERILRPEDLQYCSQIFLVNSVRRMQAAIVLPDSF